VKRTITIDPVTRIEGHARVFLNLSGDGSLESAGLVVNELRGFERILVGMEADRMPLVTARICGVCPSAHHLAACKALDVAAGVEPPPAAKLLRELLYMGHFIHSHALSLFVLQGPDLFLGLDADPAVRNVVGLVSAYPEVAKKALRLRSIGQKINELVGGRGTHPVTAVAGGITFQLDDEKKGTLDSWSDEALALVQELAPVTKNLLVKQLETHPGLLTDWSHPTHYMGTVQHGRTSFYDGQLRVMDPAGKPVLAFAAADYEKYLAEDVVDYSYMKQVMLRIDGQDYPYRVGALGRINCADTLGTPLADAELAGFRGAFGRPCHATVMHTYARLIELIYACERTREILNSPDLKGDTRVPVKFTAGRGVGQVEAPRGVLIHDYEIDDHGIIRAANLIVATQQNYYSINSSIMQAANSHVIGKDDDGLLNAIEFAIRCYDPCLSCATHAVGRMPLDVAVMQGGEMIRRIRREG
jgi:F420-non-reducing hydrogenase large subunit